MYYYITALFLLFSSIINCSLPEKNTSASSSAVTSPKELKPDALVKIIIEEDNNEHSNSKSTHSSEKLLVIANLQKAKRRLSDSMERSRRKSISGNSVDDSMQESSTSLFFSPTKTITFAATAAATMENTKDLKEEIKK